MCYNEHMKIKDAQLKNGKTATIHFQALSSGFLFYALCKNHSMVAQCSFNIIKTFAKESFSPILPSNNKTESFDNEIKIHLSQLPSKDYTISKDKLIFTNGNSYNLKDTYCEIILIKINDENFFNVGLGSTLFTHMQNYAITEGCSKITAWVYPFGQFSYATYPFYRRNGFAFSKDMAGNTTATKTLTQKEPLLAEPSLKK